MLFKNATFVFLLISSLCAAQSDLYVGTNASLTTFPGANLCMYGNVINDATGGVNHNNGGTLYLFRRFGTGRGNIRVMDGPHASPATDNYNNGGSYIRCWDLVTDNTSGISSSGAHFVGADSGAGPIQIEQEMRVSHSHYFANGIIWTPRGKWRHAFLHYDGDSAVYTGLSDTTHVDGYVAKTGCTAFIFPTGDGHSVSRASTTGSSCGTRRAAYYRANAQSGTTGISGVIALPDALANCSGYIRRVCRTEFWDIDGTSPSLISLEAVNSKPAYSAWDSIINFSVYSPSKIVVTAFNGRWQNLRSNPPPASLIYNGMVASLVSVSPDTAFSAFTWALADSDVLLVPEAGAGVAGSLKVGYRTSSDLSVWYSFGDNAGDALLQLIGATGQCVFEERLHVENGENDHDLRLGAVVPGVYLLRITLDSRVLQTKIYTY